MVVVVCGSSCERAQFLAYVVATGAVLSKRPWAWRYRHVRQREGQWSSEGNSFSAQHVRVSNRHTARKIESIPPVRYWGTLKIVPTDTTVSCISIPRKHYHLELQSEWALAFRVQQQLMLHITSDCPANNYIPSTSPLKLRGAGNYVILKSWLQLRRYESSCIEPMALLGWNNQKLLAFTSGQVLRVRTIAAGKVQSRSWCTSELYNSIQGCNVKYVNATHMTSKHIRAS